MLRALDALDADCVKVRDGSWSTADELKASIDDMLARIDEANAALVLAIGPTSQP